MDEVNNTSPVETKKKYRINTGGVKKLLGKIGKPVLKVVLVLGILYLTFVTYILFTNTPQKVRVTNLTGRSATVSWVTKYPSKGEVVFSETDSFAFGPFAGSQKEKSYDDRDYAYAQLEQMQDIVDLRSDALDVENVEVKKQGRYYVHHVTVLGLEENTKYSFRVGNGTMWWDVDSSDQEYFEHEAPTISEFWFNTLNDPESLLGPNPAYGRVYTMEDNDGFLTENPSTDAMVFSYAARQSNDEISMILSSLTNLKGGWAIDKANFRDLNGLSTTFEQGDDNLYVYAQFEDLIPRVGINIAYGTEDSPAPAIVANGEDDVRSEEASTKEFIAMLIGKVDACYYCNWDTSGNNNDDGYEDVETSNRNDVAEISVPKPVYTPPPPKPKPVKEAGADEWWRAYESGSGDSRSLDNVDGGDGDDTSYWDQVNVTVKNDEGEKVDLVEQIKKKVSEGAVITAPTETSVEDFHKSLGEEYVEKDTSMCATKPGGGANIIGSRGCSTTIDANGNATADTGFSQADCFCKGPDGKNIRLDFQCRPAGCANPAARPYDDYLNEYGDICEYETEAAKGGASGLCEGSVVSSCTKKGEPLVLKSNLDGCVPGTPPVELSDKEDGLLGDDLKDGTIHCCKEGKPVANVDPYTCSEKHHGVNCINDEEIASVLAEKEILANALDDYKEIGVGKEGCQDHQTAYRKISNSWVYCFNNKDLAIVTDAVGVDSCGNEKVKLGGHIVRGDDDLTSMWSRKSVEVDFGDCGAGSLCDTRRGFGECKDIAVESSDMDAFESCKEEGKVPMVDYRGVFACRTTGQAASLQDSNMWTEIDSKLVSKAYAADITPETDETFVYFPSDGLYEVFFDGESVGKRLALEEEGEMYYIDRDGEPGYLMPSNLEDIQDDEDIIFDPVSVEITASKVAENFQVELKEGINIISFPFVPIDGEEALRASDLMGYTNTSSIRINHITFFEDGRWKPGYHALSTDETTNSGEDFVLTMGKGYLIIAEEDMLGDNALQVPGRALESEVPVAYKPGWNLIGVHGYIQSYSARTLLDSVNTLDGVTVDNVTWWPTSKGRYEGFQQSDGIEYGFDYPIVKDLGYFVRVSEFIPADTETTSVIWAPGTDAHNTVGSN